jgi:hypothetical protein
MLVVESAGRRSDTSKARGGRCHGRCVWIRATRLRAKGSYCRVDPSSGLARTFRRCGGLRPRDCHQRSGRPVRRTVTATSKVCPNHRFPDQENGHLTSGSAAESGGGITILGHQICKALNGGRRITWRRQIVLVGSIRAILRIRIDRKPNRRCRSSKACKISSGRIYPC